MENTTQQKLTVGQKAVVALGLAGASGFAMADLPAAATTAISGLSADATSMISSVWGIVALVAGAFALMGLFKKGVSKAV